jgi:YVTN family beta-propeller protein
MRVINAADGGECANGSMTEVSGRSRGGLAMKAIGQVLTLVALAAMSSSEGCRRSRPRAAGLLFVSNETAGTVSVIDLATGALRARIDVHARPRGIRVAPDGHTVFVALTGSRPAGPPTMHAAAAGVDDTDAADHRADGIAMIDTNTHRVRHGRSESLGRRDRCERTACAANHRHRCACGRAVSSTADGRAGLE